MTTKNRLRSFARLLLVSFVAGLSAACSVTPTKCEPIKIPESLLVVPEEDQMEAFLEIFDPKSPKPAEGVRR